MIELSCTNCRRVLRIDDGFAGGVCRCRHCKTLQTVPRDARHVRPGSAPAEGSGLDDLAGVIASSGLSSDDLTRPRPPDRSAMMPWIIALGATGLAGVLALGWLLTSSGRTRSIAMERATESPGMISTGSASASTITDTQAAPVGKSPQFLGIPLEGVRIAYVLDRGAATSDLFDALKVATLQSLKSLTAEQQFQIVFWDNGEGPVTIPAAPSFALPNRIGEAERAMDKVFAFGSSDAATALAQAFKVEPVVLVIVSGKGGDLDDAFVAKSLAARGLLKTQIHTVSLGEGDSPGLEAIANQTGGRYARITGADIRALTR